MSDSKYHRFYELLEDRSGCTMSGKTGATFCNYDATPDKSGVIQVRVHRGYVEAGLAFDKANASIAIAEYARALACHQPVLRQSGNTNHYLMTNVQLDPLLDTAACVEATGLILASLRSALDECNVFVE